MSRTQACLWFLALMLFAHVAQAGNGERSGGYSDAERIRRWHISTQAPFAMPPPDGLEPPTYPAKGTGRYIGAGRGEYGVVGGFSSPGNNLDRACRERLAAQGVDDGDRGDRNQNGQTHGWPDPDHTSYRSPAALSPSDQLASELGRLAGVSSQDRRVMEVVRGHGLPARALSSSELKNAVTTRMVGWHWSAPTVSPQAGSRQGHPCGRIGSWSHSDGQGEVLNLLRQPPQSNHRNSEKVEPNYTLHRLAAAIDSYTRSGGTVHQAMLMAPRGEMEISQEGLYGEMPSAIVLVLQVEGESGDIQNHVFAIYPF